MAPRAEQRPRGHGAKRSAPRINFAHLRNITREPDGSFYEAEHLEGDTDMVGVVAAVLRRGARRHEGRPDGRSRCGPTMATCFAPIGRKVNPGYSYIGRLKGLAELRGVMRAVAARS